MDVYPNAAGTGEHDAPIGTAGSAKAFTRHAPQAPQPSPSAVRACVEGLPDLRAAVHLAEEMGARLGEREVLLGPVPKRCAQVAPVCMRAGSGAASTT